jgi:hypothetical protein
MTSGVDGGSSKSRFKLRNLGADGRLGGLVRGSMTFGVMGWLSKWTRKLPFFEGLVEGLGIGGRLVTRPLSTL